MKKIIYTLLTFAVLIIPACYTTQNVSEANNPSQTFSQLDQYGQWINVPQEGTVWQPNVSQQWQPYSDGRWVWTANGWMWDSYEPYGWVVYHYGYWNNDPQYGWIWEPSYQWSPARVVWYNQNGYVGWAPQPSPNYPVANVYYSQTNYWVVVPQKNFTNQDVVKYRTNENNSVIRNIRNNEGGRAPDVREIENVTNQRIQEANIVNEKVSAGSRQIIRARVQPAGSTRNDQINNSGRQQNNNNFIPPPAQRPASPAQIIRPAAPTPGARPGTTPLRNSVSPNPQRENIKPIQINQPIDNNKIIPKSMPKRTNNVIRGAGAQKVNKTRIGQKKPSPVKQKKAAQVRPNNKRDSVNIRR
ncbi:MAG: DUF6600 domain-containing protein [Ignavibacteriaceae bacterium]